MKNLLTMSEEKYLNQIRKYINDGKMSFIVGTGFSKNISNVFPSWGELLRPMILEMYPECSSKSIKKEEKAIKNIIYQKGYLEIASEYVRRKGYHEAIDIYIEKHIPYLIKQPDGSWIIMHDGKQMTSRPHLECHKKLLSLGVKHIYTFNYDNALDTIGETESADNILNEQNNANFLMTKYEDVKSSCQEYYNKLIGYNIPNTTQFQATSSINTFDTLRNEVNAKIRDHTDIGLKIFPNSGNIDQTYQIYKNNVEILDKKISEQKSLSDSAEMKRSEIYQLITDSFHISLTENNKNIYKLHGNLRLPNHKEFGFDYDTHKQYVITKEDYKEYPNKHDAFVNLMKISLLKGKFCIIGFSCDDPNFLMWIDWVKDVLDKSKRTKTSKCDNSIYFINVGKEPISEDKLLLLQNHYITPINLYSIFPSAKDERKQIFDFLSSVETDGAKYDNYYSAWDKIKIDYSNKQITSNMCSCVERVYQLTPYNRIPSQTNHSHYKRMESISFVQPLLNNKQYLNEKAKLIYAAIKGELIPVSFVLTNQNIKQLLKSKVVEDKLKIDYSLLIMRSRILQHKSVKVMRKTRETSEYECIWGELFMFKFNKAWSMLDKWSPKEKFNSVRKQMLSSLFDDSGILNDIELCRDDFDCFQDYKYALDIFFKANSVLSGKKVIELTDALKRINPNLISCWETIDLLLSDISKPDENCPYGNIKKSYEFSSYDVKLVNSIKILQILIEMGLSTEIRNRVLIAENKWVSICEVLYEYCPYPCLYFTLMYGNSKDIIRKIAQDYIYSSKLYAILPNLLNEILQASLDSYCPGNVKKGIYIVAPIFMQAVAPEKWFNSFKNVYTSFDFSPTNPNRNRMDADYDFFIRSTKLINNLEFKKEVVRDCLSKQSQVDNFYNELIIASSSGIFDDDNISKQLLDLTNIANNSAQYYVLLNMRKFVNNDTLCNKFLELPDEEYDDFALLNGVTWFAKDYPKLQIKLRGIVINSPLLWRTGISDDGQKISYYGYGSMLDINTIQNNIEFSKEQIIKIYEEMLTALKAVSNVIHHQSEGQFNLFDDWTSVLIIMILFMRKNQDILRNLETYNNSRKKAVLLYKKNRGGAKISDLLIDDSHTGNAIKSLVNDIIITGVSRYQHEYILIANKIIMRNSQYLNSCFNHFVGALIEYNRQFKQDIFKPILKSILDSYEPYFSLKKVAKWDIQHAEKNVIEKELLDIYKVYISWGGKSAFWAKYKPIYYDGISQK